MKELIKRLERVIATGAPDKDGMHPISAETVLEVVRGLSEHGTNLAEVGTDCISRQQAIDALERAKQNIRHNIERAIGRAICEILDEVENGIKQLPPIQPEIVRCKDCKYWVPGYITDNDDFIPPKCGEWQQMVGHSSDDYCSLAERREVTT